MNYNQNKNRTPICFKLSKIPKKEKLILPFDITAFLLKHKLTKTHSQIQIYNQSRHQNSSNINNRYLLINNSSKSINHSFSPQWSDIITSNQSSQKTSKHLLQLQDQNFRQRRKNRLMFKDKMTNMSMFESYEYWLNQKVNNPYLPLVLKAKTNKRKSNSQLSHSCSQQEIERAHITNKLILKKINETFSKKINEYHINY